MTTAIKLPRGRRKSASLLQDLQGQFDGRTAVPKYHQLKELLRAQIVDGSLRPPDRLPTAETLAGALGITRFTVDKAINELVDEGLVDRVQGRGTFVRRSSPQITSREIVGIVMPSSGHIWDGFMRSMIQGLNQRELFCMIADFVLESDSPPSAALVNKLKRLISSDPAYLVVHGISRFPYELIKGFPGRLIFAECYETDDAFTGSQILSDYRAGGRLVAEHLFSLGHRKIAVVVPRLEPRHKANLDLVGGVRDVIREKGITETCVEICEAEDEQSVARAMDAKNGPRAFFCVGDYRAAHVYELAKQRSLRIGKDIAVVGYFDTPWCQQLFPNLTSVRIHEDAIAQAIVKVITENVPPATTLIPPSLIVRGSCGGSSKTTQG